ncbi:MAG TPA: amidohydrolase family protein [Pseudolabrys sp.]|nr:amidohydrolase family protein [Pseudolabrys sp.]
MSTGKEPPPIAGPVAKPCRPRQLPLPDAWDSHAHIFGPAGKFPYAPGRGYTPPDAPVERYVALLDHLGFAHGVLVQGNAHGFDNRVLLDALLRHPQRLRGVAITDTRIAPAVLRDWHKLGMRGLRFHLFSEVGKPGYVRGVGLDVFEVFRSAMGELGWSMQVFCDWRLMAEIGPRLREIAREMPVIIDHMLHIPALRGVNDANFQALLKLVGEGQLHAKVSAPYRLSDQFPDYPDAKPFHDALVRANPERLMWGTDWPHPSIPGNIMPDDGHLLDLFFEWTPDAAVRRRILVETPARLFGF